jgi:hypothetical protein
MATSHTPSLSFRLRQLHNVLACSKSVQIHLSSKICVASLDYKIQLIVDQLEKGKLSDSEALGCLTNAEITYVNSALGILRSPTLGKEPGNLKMLS